MDSTLNTSKKSNQKLAINTSYHPYGIIKNPADLPLFTEKIMNCLNLQSPEQCEDNSINEHLNDLFLESSESPQSKKQTGTYL